MKQMNVHGLLVLALALGSTQAADVTIAGELMKLESTETYHLRLPDASILSLDFSRVTPLPKSVVSGFRLQATGSSNGETIVVREYEIIIPKLKAPTRIASMVFLLNVCGRNLTYTKEQFQEVWLNKHSGGKPTIQGYYKSCSYNKTRFAAAKNVIVGPIEIPCTGPMTGKKTYDAESKCDANEIYGIAFAAEAYAKKAGHDLRKYPRRLMMLPELSACPWAGLADVGCGSSCYTWINGALHLDTVFHEQGHNMGLQHSTSPTQEYGDFSCAMGASGMLRCFNAPQSYALGWADPLAVLNSTNLPDNKWQTYDVPALQTSSVNMLQIFPTWTGAKLPTFYVSYRASAGYDVLTPQYDKKVYVHVYNGSRVPFATKPELQQILGAGTGWADPTGLKVRFLAVNGDAAAVSVCRGSCDERA